jgi:hypothetical protein
VLDDGTLDIDNNAAERALRVVALGRNYVQCPIMCSSPRGRWTEVLSVWAQGLCVAI